MSKTYVPHYKHDIFVSYAHVDDQPFAGAEKGWVTTLINGLKNYLGKKLGGSEAYSLWMDDELRGNTPITPTICEQLENTAILVLILSPGYLASEWCCLELDIFLARVGKNSGCVFVVEHDQVENRPNELNDLQGYKFWRHDDAGKPRILAIPKPNPDKEPEYYPLLDDLARELTEKLQTLKEQAPSIPNSFVPLKEEKPQIVDAQLTRPNMQNNQSRQAVLQIPNYDIFISYRTSNRPWVEILATNLEQVGYTILVDFREISAGANFTQCIYSALNTCRKAIIVATPDAIESGWVREEYDRMLNRKQREPDFSFIPVILSQVPDFPFLSNIQSVNFSTISTANYAEAFYRLLCGLEEIPPGSDTFSCERSWLLPTPELPAPPSATDHTQAFLADLLTHFQQPSPPPLMLLAQSGQAQKQMVETILQRAQILYPNHCWHIAPPYTHDSDISDYFSSLAQQCGFDFPNQGEPTNIYNEVNFEYALRQQLSSNHRYFLLVSRLEHSHAIHRELLARCLRNVIETHPNRLLIMLCGGEQLHDLKYKDGTLSILNIAQTQHWQELTLADVYNLRDNLYADLPLNDAQATELLQLSGGYMPLLQACLHFYQQQPARPWQDYPSLLSEESCVWELWTSLKYSSDDSEQLHNWLNLQNQALAPYKPYLYNHLLRTLYWKNLLVKRGKQLFWRCEAMRLAGLEVYKHYRQPK